MEAPDLNRTKITDIAFSDPMSDETRKVRTHLLFVGALTVLVKVYGLRLVKLPWLDFDIPPEAPQLLDGLGVGRSAIPDPWTRSDVRNRGRVLGVCRHAGHPAAGAKLCAIDRIVHGSDRPRDRAISAIEPPGW